MSKFFTMPFSKVYPLYIKKLERKGRTKAELDTAIEWLTGFGAAELSHHLGVHTTLDGFFDAAQINPNAAKITGVKCGVRVENIDDPLMRNIRYLDKLVDELAQGKPLTKVLRD